MQSVLSCPTRDDSVGSAHQWECLNFARFVNWAQHQGEENSGLPVDYACFQPAMISDWQQTFAAHGGAPHIPFVFVQLQPCGIPPAMRYAQAQSLTEHSGIPGVGMAACFDLGDPDPLNAMGLCHSRYKMECGRRLALALMSLLPPNLGSEPPQQQRLVSPALDVVASGPTITSVAAIENGAAIELTVKNGHGMHWNGTKQCTRCCGFDGWKRDGVGITNSHLMMMLLEHGTWQYITAGGVTFPDANTTATKIVIRSPSPATPKHTQYCPTLELRCEYSHRGVLPSCLS